MATIIREIERPTLADLAGIASRRSRAHAAGAGELLRDIRLVGSGKGALALVLRHLSARKVLANKLDEVLVADWIGYWVYNQIQPFAFTAKKLSDRTRAVLVYHQYGFPQDMDAVLEEARDNKLAVIEDCAHAVASSYKGRPLGTFGDYAIYSFSKWVFCFALGGVRSQVDGFAEHAEQAMASASWCTTAVKDAAKLLSEQSLFSTSVPFRKCASLLLNMSYAIYGDALRPSRRATRLLSSKLGHEIDVRGKRYAYFRERTDRLGICDHLEATGVTPYVIPIRCGGPHGERLVRALRERGVMTGAYNFDMNRNLFRPAFAPCVWIPCHGGIPDGVFEDMIGIVSKAL